MSVKAINPSQFPAASMLVPVVCLDPGCVLARLRLGLFLQVIELSTTTLGFWKCPGFSAVGLWGVRHFAHCTWPECSPMQVAVRAMFENDLNNGSTLRDYTTFETVRARRAGGRRSFFGSHPRKWADDGTAQPMCDTAFDTLSTI